MTGEQTKALLTMLDAIRFEIRLASWPATEAGRELGRAAADLRAKQAFDIADCILEREEDLSNQRSGVQYDTQLADL